MTVTVLNCIMLYMRKLTHNFAKALFSWVSSPCRRKQTFRAKVGPYSDLQGHDLMWFPPLPLLYLPDLVSYHSLLHIPYSSPMASSLCTSGTLQPPRLCTCCSPTWSTTALHVCLASSFPSSRLLLKIPFPVLLHFTSASYPLTF